MKPNWNNWMEGEYRIVRDADGFLYIHGNNTSIPVGFDRNEAIKELEALKERQKKEECDGNDCGNESCQECCSHDWDDHNCLNCGKERDYGADIDAAMDRMRDGE